MCETPNFTILAQIHQRCHVSNNLWRTDGRKKWHIAVGAPPKNTESQLQWLSTGNTKKKEEGKEEGTFAQLPTQRDPDFRTGLRRYLGFIQQRWMKLIQKECHNGHMVIWAFSVNKKNKYTNNGSPVLEHKQW